MARSLLEDLHKLKESKHVPVKFDPLKTDSKELTICAIALEKIESTSYQRGYLSNFAYVTFLLSHTFSAPNQHVNVDCMPAIEQYKSIAQRKGYCDENGLYLTAKLNPSEVIFRAMTNPKLKNIPNFVRAFFLMKLAYLEVLPKILQNMERNMSISEFETDITVFYTYIAEIFIPNLCKFFHFRLATQNISMMLLISKLLSEFPAKLFLLTIIFIKSFNEYAIINLAELAQPELFELLKLNEYAEVCHQHVLLTVENKKIIISELTARKEKLTHDELLKIMQMKYTIFNELHQFLQIFDDKFKICIQKQEQQFKKSAPLSHEVVLFTTIEDMLPESHKIFLRHSFICPQTGKEIDIAFNQPGVKKIATHIDGPFAHYYQDREQENRKTIVRNKALANAGWINICRPLAVVEKNFMVAERRDLLNKLSTYLPFKKTLSSVFFAENKIKDTMLFFLPVKAMKTLACVNYQFSSNLKSRNTNY